MNIKSNILNYLYDKSFVISLYDNKLYIFKYSRLIDFNDNTIILDINNKLIKIYGVNLKIKRLTKDEVLIEGTLNNIKFGE